MHVSPTSPSAVEDPGEVIDIHQFRLSTLYTLSIKQPPQLSDTVQLTAKQQAFPPEPAQTKSSTSSHGTALQPTILILSNPVFCLV